MNMNEQTKRIVVNRIISHLNPVPAGAANELLQQPLADLERILTKLADTREQENVEEEALARIQEARSERAFDAAWGATLARVSLNGRRLCDVESNKQMFESLLQPHEKPSEAIYKTLALQFASKFSWETPQPKKTAADREAEFVRVCHENLLSLCDANRQMHKSGLALDAWAGASQIERAAFPAEAAQPRLVNYATRPSIRVPRSEKHFSVRKLTGSTNLWRRRKPVCIARYQRITPTVRSWTESISSESRLWTMPSSSNSVKSSGQRRLPNA
jgi:hypothetical protein